MSVGLACLVGLVTASMIDQAGGVSEMSIIAGLSVAFTLFVAQIIRNRYRNRLRIYVDGVSIGAPAWWTDHRRDTDHFMPFADIFHVGCEGRHLTLGSRTAQARPRVRTAVLSRFRFEDVHDLLLERLQDLVPDRLYSIADGQELATSRPFEATELFAWQSATRLVSVGIRGKCLLISTDRGEAFVGRFDNDLTVIAELALAEHPEEVELSVNQWGVFTGSGFLFARLEFEAEKRIHAWTHGYPEPFTLDRDARSVSYHRGIAGSFSGSEITTLWRLDLAEPMPEPLALAFILLWIQWDSLFYARSMI